MKNRNFKSYLKSALMVGGLGLATFSCSDLDDVALDKLTDASSITPEQLLASTYLQLSHFTGQEFTYALTEHSTDEMQGPTRATDWDDNGRWRNIHTHDWDAQSVDVVVSWDGLSRGHALANEAINNARGNQTVIAEATFLRAFFVFHIMDLFGQVPFKTTVDGTTTSTVLTRAEASARVISDLEAIIPNLPAASAANAGKATKEAANALLAKAYLNKAVFTSASPGGPYTFESADMTKVIAACDAVINSGKYSLTANYFDNFSPENSTKSTELVFVIANTKGQSLNANTTARSRFYMTTHYNHNPSGWNGFTTLADFYNRFEATDSRRGGTAAHIIDPSASGLRSGFLVGQQFDKDGNPLEDRQGNPLSFTVASPLIVTENVENTGVRVIKYAPDFTDIDAGGNDYVFLRYADVLMMKAEALLRSGNAAGGLTIVNQIRSARGLTALASLTETNLLAERGKELYWEGWRRNDLVRFGQFNAPNETRPSASPASRNLFPIPQKELEINPALTQNDGY